MNTIRCFKWQLSCSLKAWKKRNTYLLSRAILWPPFDYEEEWKLPKMLFKNSNRRLRSVTKFSYLYVQKAKFWPVALSLPSSSAFLPLFDGHWLKFISVGKGFGKTNSETRFSSVRSFQAIFAFVTSHAKTYTNGFPFSNGFPFTSRLSAVRTAWLPVS